MRQGPGARKSTQAADAACWGSRVHCRSSALDTHRHDGSLVPEKLHTVQECAKQVHQNQEAEFFPLAIPLPFPLLTTLNIVPAVNRKIFRGPESIFTEQAEKMNLELRGKNK